VKLNVTTLSAAVPSISWIRLDSSTVFIASKWMFNSAQMQL
jgi:hypothetical protein